LDGQYLRRKTDIGGWREISKRGERTEDLGGGPFKDHVASPRPEDTGACKRE